MPQGCIDMLKRAEQLHGMAFDAMAPGAKNASSVAIFFAFPVQWCSPDWLTLAERTGSPS